MPQRNMKAISFLAWGAIAWLTFGAPAGQAANWPQWRGPFLNGSTTETNLPDSWSKTENVLWSTPLPGPSHATPIVWDDAVFVSSPDPDGNLNLVCLDRKSGQARWQKPVGLGNRSRGRNNMASPSPVTDGKTVWALFGTGDLAAFDFSGKQLWARSLTKDFGAFVLNWIYGSSPMLYKGRLYVEVLRRMPGESFLLCLDPQTGSNIWRHVRPTDAVAESQEAYSTPMPSECGGRTEIIVAGGDYVTGHDAETGEELWRGGGMRNFQHRPDSRLVPSPVLADGLVFVCGAKRNPFLAFHDCGKGDITTNGLAWSYVEYSTDCCTPLFYQEKLFMLDGDKQMMVCFDPTTGLVHWKQPLGVKEIFRASPTGADGKLYCFSEYATAVVMSAEDGKILQTIPMGEGAQTDAGLSHSTIAAAQGCLFVRAPGRLYCVGKK
jgi:outer membrane protein assembly factor BamB